MNNKRIGMFLGLIHIILVWTLIFLILLINNKFLLSILLIFTIGTLLAYIICGNCMLTILEKRLLEKDITTIDPLLHFFRCKVNNYNRNILTILMMVTTILLIIIKINIC